MRLGSDFEKIEWNVFGLTLLEPNTFITDALICGVALYFAGEIQKRSGLSETQKVWNKYFVWTALTFLLGGFGHLFFHYFDVLGKWPGLIFGLFATYFLEIAMIIPLNNKEYKMLRTLFSIKLFIALLFLITYFLNFINNQTNFNGLLIPIIHSSIGLIYVLGFLALRYFREGNRYFIHARYALFFFILAGISQAAKINVHPWFDRNDLSHVLIIFALYHLYKMVLKSLPKNDVIARVG